MIWHIGREIQARSAGAWKCVKSCQSSKCYTFARLLLLDSIYFYSIKPQAEWIYPSAQPRDGSLHYPEFRRTNKLPFHHIHSKDQVKETQSTMGACVFIKGSLLSCCNGSIELFLHDSACGFHFSIDLQVIAITRRAMHTNKDGRQDECMLVHSIRNPWKEFASQI